jgi:hypothetical protein
MNITKLSRIMLMAVAFTASPSLASRVISDGSRITVKERGFSIVPPKGWEIITNSGKSSLILQPVFEKSMKYQRTLQVSVFSGAIDTTEMDSEKFGETIVAKYAEAMTGIENYRVRNFVPVNLKDGNSAVLYYTEFTLDGKNLMHGHLVVSSKTKNYLVTFTDLAENFEADDPQKGNLSAAWDTMVSFQVDEYSTFRLDPSAKAGIAAGVVVMLIGVFWARKAKRDRQSKEFRKAVQQADSGHMSSQPQTFGVTIPPVPSRQAVTVAQPISAYPASNMSMENATTDSDADDLSFDDDKAV